MSNNPYAKLGGGALDQELFKKPQQGQDTEEKETHQKVQTDTMRPRYRDTNHDTTIPNNHDTIKPLTEDEIFEEVRKAVRQIGKEPATQRLTLTEKQALADIEYSYKRQGMKTSGNEIIRIATNYIIRDYQQTGENSILAKVLKRLNS
jgi:hypothetical protein